jgi:hypothetical protein
MTQTIRNETNCHRDESFASHHPAADCPTSTVVRELLKNAENAALLQP